MNGKRRQEYILRSKMLLRLLLLSILGAGVGVGKRESSAGPRGRMREQ